VVSVDTAIGWSGPSPAPGVVINNFGTISATVRALDTSGGSTVRNFTLNNNAGALITSVNDAFRINSDVGTSTIAINNSGTIRNDVTMPKFPPPPRSAQNRSAFLLQFAVTVRLSAITTSADKRLSQVAP